MLSLRKKSTPRTSGSLSPFMVDLAKFEAMGLGPNPPLKRRVGYWLKSSELHCVARFRLRQQLDRQQLAHPVLTRLALLPVGYWGRRQGIVHHFNIPPGAQIGPGFLVMHRTGIWVGPQVTIGANCVIHHNVTIGQRVAGGDQGVPKIGSRVWIGPGAILTGDIVIGNGVTISAGTVLSKSVPDRCLVAGNPGRVVMTDYDNAAIVGFEMAVDEPETAEASSSQ